MQTQYPHDFGRPFVLRPANPAAGANFNQIVPANALWVIQSIYFIYDTAVAVANRNAQITISDAAGTFIAFKTSYIQVASLTQTYSWYETGFDIAAAILTTIAAQLPPRFFIMPLEILGITVINKQGADQISDIMIRGLEWLVDEA